MAAFGIWTASFQTRLTNPPVACFWLVEFKDAKTDHLKQELVTKAPVKIKEEDFYNSFADWLVNDMEECTKAICLGGNLFKDKWGTPDVVGQTRILPE